jgi:hypothetical protein
MADQNDPIENRLARIERTNRVLVGVISTTFLLMGSALLVGLSQAAPSRPESNGLASGFRTQADS